MNEPQIKHMVNRFLGWRLPEDFSPDAGISFKREFNENTPWPSKHEPVGTNLFNASQAKAMIQYLAEGLPASPATAHEPLTQTVLDELQRATAKFPTWPTDPLHALAILGEEFGELARAMVQVTYEPGKATVDDVRTEAIQTAAMALRLAMSLDQYQYAAGPQHTQGAKPRRKDLDSRPPQVWRTNA